MYRAFYRLAQRPYSKTPDPAFLYEGRMHGEALARLEHAVDEREIVVLTGEIGAGKTTLSRALIDKLDATHRIALIVYPRMAPAQMLEQIGQKLGLQQLPSKKALLVETIGSHLYELDEQGLNPVLIIDEAQLITSKAVFDELRLLCNIQLDDRSLLSLILIGQPELKTKLAKPAYRALTERIGMAYHLGALELEEARAYLRHRALVAGREQPLFTPEAESLIHAASSGIPRRMNNIAANALLMGFHVERDPVDEAIVADVVTDLSRYLGGIYKMPTAAKG